MNKRSSIFVVWFGITSLISGFFMTDNGFLLGAEFRILFGSFVILIGIEYYYKGKSKKKILAIIFSILFISIFLYYFYSRQDVGRKTESYLHDVTMLNKDIYCGFQTNGNLLFLVLERPKNEMIDSIDVLFEEYGYSKNEPQIISINGIENSHPQNFDDGKLLQKAQYSSTKTPNLSINFKFDSLANLDSLTVLNVSIHSGSNEYFGVWEKQK